MKEFMEKLYSTQYFGVILFAVIGILAVLFIIVLILALRDAKKRRQIENITEESDESAAMADVAFAQESVDPVKVEVTKETIANSIEPKKDDVVEIQESTNNTFGDIKVEAPTELPKEETSSPFPDLEITEPIKLPDNLVETAKEEAPVSIVSKEEPVLKPQQPEQFSSIFVSPGAIPKHVEEPTPSPTEMPNLSDIPAPTPVKVVNESSIIDSSAKKNPEIKSEDINVSPEEYTIK